MDIILYHNHYNKKHLKEVSEQMKKIGQPKIKAIWSNTYGAWLAVEGCHRIRAAKEIGCTPIIIDVTNNKTVTIQNDGDKEIVNVEQLTQELTDNAWQSVMISFE